MSEMNYSINYRVKGDVIRLIQDSTGHSTKEIWANLSDISQVCAERLSTKKQLSSWTQKTYPGTIIKVRIDMDKWSRDSKQYDARIKMANSSKWQTFTHKQIMEYLLEEVLMGEE